MPSEADVVVLNTCCIRENADNKLYGNLGLLKSLKDAVRACRSWWAAAWPRRTATRSARAPHVDVVFGTHNVHRAADLHRAVARRRGRSSRSSRRPLPTTRRVPVGAPRPARAGPQRVGHDPDRLRQLAARSASCPPCAVRRSAGRSTTLVAEVEALAADGVTEVTLLGQNVNSYGRDLTLAARRTGAPARVRPLFADLLAGRRRGRRHPPGALHEPAPEGPATRDDRGDGRDAGGVRAPAPAAAVGQRPRARGDAPGLHRRALPRAARGGACGGRRPGRHHRPHRRLPRRDRRRLRAHARGGRRGRSTTAPTRSSSRPGPAPRPRAMVDQFVARRRRAPSGSSGSGSWSSARRSPATRRGSAASRRSSSKGPSKQDPSVTTGRTRQNKLVHFAPPSPIRPGTYARVRVTGAAPHHLRGDVGRAARAGAAPHPHPGGRALSTDAPAPFAIVGPTAPGKSALALAVAASGAGRRDRLGRLDAGVPGHGHRHRQADVRRAGRDPPPPPRRRRSGGGLHRRRVPAVALTPLSRASLTAAPARAARGRHRPLPAGGRRRLEPPGEWPRSASRARVPSPTSPRSTPGSTSSIPSPPRA